MQVLLCFNAVQMGEGGGKDQHCSQSWQEARHRSPSRHTGGAAPRACAGCTRLCKSLLQLPALGFLLGFPSVFWCDKEYA